MTKFKVGDKVRILDASKIKGAKDHGLFSGAITTVANLDSFGDPRLTSLNGDDSLTLFSSELRYIELAPQTPTKNQRLTDAERTITTLESEVAELKAKVEALEKAQSPTSYKIGVDFARTDADISKVASQLAKLIEGERIVPAPKKSPNEQRKAIIAEAKAFVAEYERKASGQRSHREGNSLLQMYSMNVKYEVNVEKRVVVALLYRKFNGALVGKGIAKCAPDDVFNADIGKAIALGRALGLDVSRFEQAVKPTDVVVGQVYHYQFMTRDETQIITSVSGGNAKFKRISDDYTGHHSLEQFAEGATCFGTPIGLTLLDDTEAMY